MTPNPLFQKLDNFRASVGNTSSATVNIPVNLALSPKKNMCKIAANVTITADAVGNLTFFSYETIIAYLPVLGGCLYRSPNLWSRTTARHFSFIEQWAKNANLKIVLVPNDSERRGWMAGTPRSLMSLIYYWEQLVIVRPLPLNFPDRPITLSEVREMVGTVYGLRPEVLSLLEQAE